MKPEMSMSPNSFLYAGWQIDIIYTNRGKLYCTHEYYVDGVLNPLEQAERLDFMTGNVDSYNDDDDYDSGSSSYLDDNDDDYSGYRMSEAERRRRDAMLNRFEEARKQRETRKALIIGGIMIAASIIFASSPGIILFIGAMLLSAKISKMF